MLPSTITTRILVFVLLILTSSATVLAQANPTFEVATIKPSDPEKKEKSLYLSDGKFQAHGQTLMTLIKFAYGLNTGSDQQVSGGPKWMNTDQFDLDAKEDEQTSTALKAMPRLQHMQQVRLMLQALLADRFDLKVHHESKMLPVFALVVAKSGMKMTEVNAAPSDAVPGAKDPKTWTGIRQMGRGELEGHNVTMDIFSEVVSRQPEMAGRMVIDQTNLTGKYNFMLKWTPESGSGDSEVSADATAPLFLTALQEQLGLKVDSTKAPVDTVVVDAARLPTSN